MKIKANTWYLLPKGSKVWTRLRHGYGLPESPNYWSKHPRTLTQEDEIVKTSFSIGVEGGGVNIGNWSSLRVVLADELKSAKLKPVSKEIRDQLTKDSVWEFIEEYKFPGVKEFPAGTRFKITGKPAFGTLDEKLIPTTIGKLAIRFAGNIIENVEAGKVKTYWKLLRKDDTPVTTKRFENLGRVKSSVTVRTQMFSEEVKNFETAHEDSPPEWAVGGYVDEQFDHWKAVHYNIKNEVIETVELDKWFFEKVLKT